LSRTLVVGDVQGCCDELEDLLELVGFNAGIDDLISVGDLVNKGPRSLDALRLVRGLGGEMVLGNHEIHLLEIAAGEPRYDDTMEDVLAAEDLPQLIDWIVDRPEPLVMLRDGWAVVHAGLPPRFNLNEDARRENDIVRAIWWSEEPLARRVAAIRATPSVQFLTRVRYCNQAGERPEDDDAEEPPGFVPWFDVREPGSKVAFGHWARLDPARAARPHLRFLDTGCVYGRALTGWLVEEDRLVSVPARRQYWPPA
jgi:bis(5'-nucleosyl)-tetraphosphatase (symmetrical)